MINMNDRTEVKLMEGTKGRLVSVRRNFRIAAGNNRSIAETLLAAAWRNAPEDARADLVADNAGAIVRANPRWYEITIFNRDHADQIRDAKSRAFATSDIAARVLGREPSPRQAMWILQIFVRLGGDCHPEHGSAISTERPNQKGGFTGDYHKEKRPRDRRNA